MKTRLILTIAGLIVILATTSGSAQIQPNSDCIAAKTWHLQHAMKVGLQPEQDYHLGAADAANQLSTMGGNPCQAWRDWANPANSQGGWSTP